MRYLAAFLFLIGVVCLFHDVPRAQVPVTGAGQGAHAVASGGAVSTAFDAASWAENTSGNSVSCGQAASSCSTSGIHLELFWTHTPVGTPTCAVLFYLSNGGAGILSGAKYNGTSMTSLGSETQVPGLSGDMVSGFYLASPSPGAQTVLVSWGSAYTFAAISFATFTGTGTNCYRAATFSVQTASSTTSITNTVTTSTNDMVVDFLAESVGGTATPGGSQTIRTCPPTTGSCSSTNGSLGISTAASGSSSLNMTWSSASQNFVDVAMSVQHQ